jgi:hypothetical protein
MSFEHDHVQGTSESALHVSSGIGQLAERSLHAGLKEYLAQPGDEFEVKLDRYVIDIIRGEQLIEIQTRHLYALRPKLRRLLEHHHVQVVHSLPAERYILRQDAGGNPLSRRKSPKRAAIYDIFSELVRVPDLVAHPNFSLAALLIGEEQVWRDDGQGSWRRGRWSIIDRRLLEVMSSTHFQQPVDYLALLPPLPEPFTNYEIAEELRIASHLAQKMTYVLRALGLVSIAAVERRTYLQVRNHPPQPQHPPD